MGDKDQKRREGGEDHCGVQFLCNLKPLLVAPSPESALSDGLGVRCVQLLVKLCLQTKEGDKWEKEERKASQ